MGSPMSSLLIIATLAISVLAESPGLQQGLSNAHITAVFLEAPRMLLRADHVSRDPSSPFTPTLKAVSTVNLRYDYAPVAVTYPSTKEQVATIVALGSSEDLQVVARSGGVSRLLFLSTP